MKPNSKLIFLTAIFFACAYAAHAQNNKVQDRSLFRKQSSDIIVTFAESLQPVFGEINSRNFPNKGARLRATKRSLQAATRRSHAPVIRNLGRFYEIEESQTKSFWITNQLLVRGANPRVISYLSGIPSVKQIREDSAIVRGALPLQPPRPIPPPEGIQWGVSRIRAPEIWNETRGDDVRIAVIHTGVRATHEALRDSFAGVEDYGWFDTTRTGSQEPIDDIGFGTHFAGIAAGSNGIGVAPGSKFMACRACFRVGPSFICMESDILECGEWILCPSLPNGENEDCSKAADVISISWVFWNLSGGDGLSNLIESWRSANIFASYANGNIRVCRNDSDQAPPYPELRMTVNPINLEDMVLNGSRKNPTVVAPGDQIWSADNSGDGDYFLWDGTEVSAPFVAGAAALLISKNKEATVGEIEELLIDTTFRDLNPSGIGSECNVDENEYPNEIAGYGLIDVEAAYKSMTGQQ